MERVEQIALNLTKLIRASGGNVEETKVLLPEDLDVVDSGESTVLSQTPRRRNSFCSVVLWTSASSKVQVPKLI